jgi:electron transfer flavoprotein alpha subunit
MGGIFVLAEHRQGELRDVTLELLAKGRDLASALDKGLTCVLLGSNVDALAGKIREHADHVVVVDDEKLENFNAESYQIVLKALLSEKKPDLTLIGHTAFGVDLAPALACDMGVPLATDCVDIRPKNGTFLATRQVYGGKMDQIVSFGDVGHLMVTLRAGVFQPGEGSASGEIVVADSALTEDVAYRRFLQYIEEAKGDVDISGAEVVIGVGRGIKEQENMALVEELATQLGGVLACSRPVVDAGWLPKDRQIGSSGKTIKAKIYVAIGISGAFQHVSGIRGTETIVAINKDPSAPIFGEADYGIVSDLFKAVPSLTEKIKELKGS